MIFEVRSCHNCNGTNLVRNGKNATNQQRYRCKDCKVTRILDYKQKSRLFNMDQIVRTYFERFSSRSTGRIFDVSHVTIQRWFKKSPVTARFRYDDPKWPEGLPIGSGRGLYFFSDEGKPYKDLDSTVQANKTDSLVLFGRRKYGVLSKDVAQATL